MVVIYVTRIWVHESYGHGDAVQNEESDMGVLRQIEESE